MRKGLRFQTKLMATLVAAITAVSLALVLVTENKVSQTYTRQFSREFTHLVKQLEESSEERSQEFLELSAKLAAHPFIAASLAGTETRSNRVISGWNTSIPSASAAPWTNRVPSNGRTCPGFADKRPRISSPASDPSGSSRFRGDQDPATRPAPCRWPR